MPTTELPEKLLEVFIGRLLQRSHGIDLEAVSHSPRSHLDTARLWAVIQVYRHAAAAGLADLDLIAGAAQVSVARDVISSWITETLAQSAEFGGRPDRTQVQGALERIARGVLLERAPVMDETRPMKLGAPQPPAAEPVTTRMRVPATPALLEPPTRPFRPPATMPPPPGPRPPRH